MPVMAHGPPPPPDLATAVAKAVLDLEPVRETGVAVAVLQGGEVTYLGGFGVGDRENQTRVDRHTTFAVGSATKAFTSMGVAMLAEQALVAFEAPIKTYLPDFKMKDGDASAQMTLQDILSHQTGLPRHDGLWYLGPLSDSQLFYRLPYLDPNPRAGFRKGFEYNNMMYMTAGYVVETMTGRLWPSHISSRIFGPLDMRLSHFSIAEFARTRHRAKGYVGETALPLKDISNIGPAGAIHSNAVDMARWVSLHLRRGLTESGTRIIPEAALEKMYRKCVAVPVPVGAPELGYGLGWFVSSIDGKRILFHAGHTDGYSVYVSFMPEEKLGVIVLTNQHRHPFPDQVAARIYGFLLRASIDTRFISHDVTREESLPRTLATLLPDHQPSSRASCVSVDEYCGRYANDGYGDVTVRRLGSDLRLSYYDRDWLLHRRSDTSFYFDLHAYGTTFPVPVVFAPTASGHIDALTLRLEQKVPPIGFARK